MLNILKDMRNQLSEKDSELLEEKRKVKRLIDLFYNHTDDSQLVSYKIASIVMNISARDFKKLRENNTVPFQVIGGKNFFLKKDILDFIKLKKSKNNEIHE